MTEIVMLDGPETRAAEIEAFRTEFLRYAEMDNLSQPCPVGKLRQDFTGIKFRQTVWQVIADAMTEKDDFTRRAMELLCKSAAGFYCTQEAADLLRDMAEHWAEFRCEL